MNWFGISQCISDCHGSVCRTFAIHVIGWEIESGKWRTQVLKQKQETGNNIITAQLLAADMNAIVPGRWLSKQTNFLKHNRCGAIK